MHVRGAWALGSSEAVVRGVRQVADEYFSEEWIERSGEHSTLYVSNRQFVDWALAFINILFLLTVIFMLFVTGIALLREGWNAEGLAGTVGGCLVLIGAVFTIEMVRRIAGSRVGGGVGGSYLPLPGGFGGILCVDEPVGEGHEDQWRAAALHELVHRFEHVMDEIGDLERNFYEYRGGDFFHEYCRKKYAFGNRWEILSVGYEYLVFGNVNMLNGSINYAMDDEHESFVYRVLGRIPE